jgi:hypothetical protein
MGRQVIPLQMDTRHLDQIFQAVDDTVRHLGRIDILVNNAGIAPDNLAENVREEDFDTRPLPPPTAHPHVVRPPARTPLAEHRTSACGYS